MSSYIRKKTPGNTEWFVHDRFGMFIHFGLYAAPARHEWIRHRECISNEDYQKYFDHFDPDMFDAKEWARAAKQAGMKVLLGQQTPWPSSLLCGQLVDIDILY